MATPRTLSQEIASTEEGRRLLQQESAIMEVTELICEIMEQKNVSRSELADRLGRTKGYITQLLDGRANMTIRTLADVFGALGEEFHFCTRANSVPTEESSVLHVPLEDDPWQTDCLEPKWQNLACVNDDCTCSMNNLAP